MPDYHRPMSATPPAHPRSPAELFVAFTLLALQGFGGVLAIAQRVLCEQRRWLTPQEFLTLAAWRWGQARRDWPAVRAFKAGMAPIVIALMAATGWVLLADALGWRHLALAAAAALLVWRTRVHLLWLIAAGAGVGALGWV